MNDQSISLPATAAETSAERPWPVRHLSPKIGDYLAKLPPVWVDGQVLNVKRWKHMVFLTLRDTEENMSVKATIPAAQVDALGSDLTDGTRVVMHVKPSWWTKNGDVQMQGSAIQSVGLGDLLARIEILKEALAAEGLFDPERKQPLPFIPRTVGLVCANQGDAEHDVVVNARRRWPAVRFEIRRVTVQGARCVPETSAALRELDAHPDVDVLVVARGGGSLEDLLPFSDESLVRLVAACTTPVVSAIGHEKDSPLLDLAADVRASTPTDAGKLIVPDAAMEREGLRLARRRMTRSLAGRLQTETATVASLVSRPVMARPLALVDARSDELSHWRTAAGRALVNVMSRAESQVRELAATLRVLSPQHVLDRGYAVVRTPDGAVLTDAAQTHVDEHIAVRLAAGSLTALVTHTSS